MSLNSVKRRRRCSGWSKKPSFCRSALSCESLASAPELFDRLRLAREATQLLHFLAHLIRVARERDRLQHLLEPLALALLHFLQLFGVGKVGGRLPHEILRALQAFFEAPRAVLQRAAHREGARREPALVEGHQETDRPGSRVLALGGSPRALPLHEPRDVAVEVELGAVDLEVDGVRDALGEDRLRGPGAVRAALGEVDHRLLRAAEIERRAAAVHRLADGFHIRVGVSVEKLQEQAEVLRITLVGCCREQQHMVRAVPQQLAQLVAHALVRLVGCRHAMCFVDDDEVPMNLPEAGQDIGALREIERCNDTAALEPLIHAELLADVLALHH